MSHQKGKTLINTEKNTSNKFNIKELGMISFGQLDGENDQKLDSDTFFPTETIQRLLRNNYNYVLSPKGVGKSAIFNAITSKFIPDWLFDYQKHSIVPINKAFGNDNDYLNPEKFCENENRRNNSIYWGLYIMGELLKDIFNNHSSKSNFLDFKSKIRNIEGLKDKFKLYNVLEVINQMNIGFAFNISGQTIEVKPNVKFDGGMEKLNLNDVFQIINDFYKENNIEALIVIDKIDNFVSKESIEIQKNYLQGLIDCIEEISTFRNIDPLLFLRTDLFYAFDLKFEYDKLKERKIELKWEESEILNFIVYRFLSNKYIWENFVGHFLLFLDSHISSPSEVRNWKDIIKKIWSWIIKNALGKNSGKIREKNIPYKTSENFLNMFFPCRVNFYGDRDFCEWIFESFRDSNDFINPRVLIFFFNRLFENQNLYNRQNKILDGSMEVELSISSPRQFKLFDESIIVKTYQAIQHEEIINIYKLLKSKKHQIIFKMINSKSFEDGKFRTGDFNIKKLNIEREELENLLIHLKLLGFCREIENQFFIVPLIYRIRLEPPSGMH
jgi:hypothetical protein